MVPSMLGYFVLSQSANAGDNPIVPANATSVNTTIIFFESILIKYNFKNIKDNRIICSSL